MAFSMARGEAGVETGAGTGRALGLLAAFRGELYRCLTARADALFELADAVLCAGAPVRVLAELSLAPGHQRGHGALYDALNCGEVQIARLRRALAGLPLPAWPDGRHLHLGRVQHILRRPVRVRDDRLQGVPPPGAPIPSPRRYSGRHRPGQPVRRPSAPPEATTERTSASTRPRGRPSRWR